MTYRETLMLNLTGKLPPKPAKSIKKDIIAEEVSQGLEWQMAEGFKIEHEHQPTYNFIVKYLEENKKLPPADELFKHIAEDHLNDDKQYYTHLVAMLKKSGETDY